MKNLVLAGCAMCFAELPSPAATLPVLDSAAAVHGMPREEAAKSHPVKVRGVITFAYPGTVGSFVMEDDSGGIYVKVPPPGLGEVARTPGMEVVVTGVTKEGGYAPVILASEVTLLGQAAFPPALPTTVNQLLTGKFDSKLVRISGVVQQAYHREQLEKLGMELAGEFGRITIFALDPGGVVPQDLIDAEVTVEGVCFPFFNERSQIAGVRIEMNSAASIRVDKPAPADPFSAPRVELAKLHGFVPSGTSFHRQRVAGTITLIDPGKFLYIQEGTDSLRVNLAAGTADSRLQVGTEIEASGFAQVRGRFVELQRALVRPIGVGQLPAPLPTSRTQVLHNPRSWEDPAAEGIDGRLVSITGKLEKIEDTSTAARRQLFIESDGQMVTATLLRADDESRFQALRPGSELEITGVCALKYSDTWPALDHMVPVEMELILRDLDDIVVVRAASWWTADRMRLALWLGTGVLMLAFTWAWVLRREVAKRTAELAGETRARRDAEVEFSATLRERERMAVDLHDTVEQALTGVSYQLEVSEVLHLEKPETSLHHLYLAKQLLSQSREEVRRSVWNLRAQSLNGRLLSEALRDISTALETRNPVSIQVEVRGEETDLPEYISGHLLLLAQESMTNALKHGNPTEMSLTLEFMDPTVRLRVKDNGRGFDVKQAPGIADGHLGMQGMRERMKKLNGDVEFKSCPGSGCEVVATVDVVPS